MLLQSYNMLSVKHVVVQNSPTIGCVDQLRRAANRALAEQDLRRVFCISTKYDFTPGKCYLNTNIGL